MYARSRWKCTLLMLLVRIVVGLDISPELALMALVEEVSLLALHLPVVVLIPRPFLLSNATGVADPIIWRGETPVLFCIPIWNVRDVT